MIKLKLRLVAMNLHEDDCEARFWCSSGVSPTNREQEVTLRFERRDPIVLQLLPLVGDYEQGWFELILTRSEPMRGAR